MPEIESGSQTTSVVFNEDAKPVTGSDIPSGFVDHRRPSGELERIV